MIKRCLTLLLVGVASLGPAATAVADGGGANNVVLVQTTADGASLSRAGVQAVPFAGTDAQSTNLADATATSCQGCRSVAVAVQAVFLTNDPSVVAPTNAAVAVNAGCAGCVSFAYAYQYVVTTDGPVYLAPAARAQLDDLRGEFAAVAASGEPLDQMRADLDALAAQFRAAVDAGLTAAGRANLGGVAHEDVQVG